MSDATRGPQFPRRADKPGLDADIDPIHPGAEHGSEQHTDSRSRRDPGAGEAAPTPGFEDEPFSAEEDYAADERPEPSESTEPISYTTEPSEPTD